MAHLDIYQCDRKLCRAEKPAMYVGSDSEREGPFLPLSWLSVSSGSRSGTHTFCSIRCLENWARQERKS